MEPFGLLYTKWDPQRLYVQLPRPLKEEGRDEVKVHLSCNTADI
jgi:hypothetical protein